MTGRESRLTNDPRYTSEATARGELTQRSVDESWGSAVLLGADTSYNGSAKGGVAGQVHKQSLLLVISRPAVPTGCL